MARAKRVQLLHPLSAYGEHFKTGTVLEVDKESELAYQVYFPTKPTRCVGTVSKRNVKEVRRG